ncbi:hypothetical protein FACS1894159_04880 [Bacteroidia bacterium]|nr:hypothetical protein FACS1894159_04880 [Bacteroidia bacterium]
MTGILACLGTQRVQEVQGAQAAATTKNAARGGERPNVVMIFSDDHSRSAFNKDYKLIYNAFWQLPYQPVDIGGTPFWKDLVKLNGQGRLDAKFATWFTPERPIFELYDLKADPSEFVNLAGDERYAQVEYELKLALQRLVIAYRDIVPTPIPGGKNNRTATAE